MLKKLNDKNFESFIGGSFYSVIGFYYPSAENQNEMLNAMGEFEETHGNVACGTMDITGQNIPGEYGIDQSESPIVVVFKQANPFKVVTNFSSESIANAIVPPGKNITLQ